VFRSVITSEAEALAAAQSVAARLAKDVVRRDAANENPAAEVQLIREAGLLPLLVPA
jgi:hypothetical protein